MDLGGASGSWMAAGVGAGGGKGFRDARRPHTLVICRRIAGCFLGAPWGASWKGWHLWASSWVPLGGVSGVSRGLLEA